MVVFACNIYGSQRDVQSHLKRLLPQHQSNTDMTLLQRGYSLILVGLVGGIPLVASGQIGIGADIVNRYIWRGADFGESLSIQPNLAYSTGNVEVGVWASYSVSSDGAGANEHNFYLAYSIPMGESGSIDLGVTDYYFPEPDGPKLFNFESGDEGAHLVELVAGFTGPDPFPISVYAGLMAHNDPDRSLYIEGSYPASVGGVDLGLTLGIVANKSIDVYSVEKASIVNMGLSASKELPITEQFSLPLSVAWIVNPTAERSFLVFGISLAP